MIRFLGLALLVAVVSLCSAWSAEDVSLPQESVRELFGGRTGAFIVINCRTGQVIDAFPAESAKRLPPCSTFKIWNALAGLENGILTSPDEPFYKWDGTVRSIAEWNRDLTLKEAFQVSCVPAFQALARRIGAENMAAWVKKLGYGDGDISSGLDVFWLPAEGRKTILISPAEQAALIRKLVVGKLQVSEHSREVLRELMFARKSDKGTLYGKTGTGHITSKANLGWYVGYVETSETTMAFACTLVGEGVAGKDAWAVVEEAFGRLGCL